MRLGLLRCLSVRLVYQEAQICAPVTNYWHSATENCRYLMWPRENLEALFERVRLFKTFAHFGLTPLSATVALLCH